MKATSMLTAFALFAAICLGACKEHEPVVPPRTPDYRDSLVGACICKGYHDSFMMNVGNTYDTTFARLVIVAVVDSTSGQISFDFGNGGPTEFAVLQTNGVFRRTVAQYRSDFEGHFYGEDSLYIHSSWSTNAASSSSDYYCKRQ
ncbi:MAG TPA: hypothetical protein VHS96_18135 [Bacteroidia bacterium]|nr:hypothetical protein [Bacteroidia bacterium]